MFACVCTYVCACVCSAYVFVYWEDGAPQFGHNLFHNNTATLPLTWRRTHALTGLDIRHTTIWTQPDPQQQSYTSTDLAQDPRIDWFGGRGEG